MAEEKIDNVGDIVLGSNAQRMHACAHKPVANTRLYTLVESDIYAVVEMLEKNDSHTLRIPTNVHNQKGTTSLKYRYIYIRLYTN